jgi:hypothetical protein
MASLGPVRCVPCGAYLPISGPCGCTKRATPPPATITLAVDPAELAHLQRLLQAIGERQIRLMVSGATVNDEHYATARKWAAICKTRLDREG